MIPHEREMVERLKDKPFVLVSISVDEKKETLTAFLAKEKMPWTHWWNGSDGGIIDDWDVKYYPTIYVLDPDGVIRHKDLRGDELEKAVNNLLAKNQIRRPSGAERNSSHAIPVARHPPRARSFVLGQSGSAICQMAASEVGHQRRFS